MFIVTLFNPAANCAYKGKPAKTMPQAFRNARHNASDEFLNYRALPGDFYILFESARNKMLRQPKPFSVNAANHYGGVSVSIERMNKESE